MTTKDFLLAFTRFCNLYSNPDVLYTDNGSYFLQGMQILAKSSLDDDFVNYLIQNRIRHHKIPLYAAWFGAIYERLIKMVKF